MFFDITSNINNTLDLLQSNKNILDQNNVNVSVEFLLNKNLLEKLCQCCPNKLIKIITTPNHLVDDLENSELFDKKNLKIVLENVAYMQENYNNKFVFREGFSIEEALIASKRVNDWVDEINNAKNNDEPLSPLEKFLYAYQICTSFYYNESDNNRDASRFLFGVLNSDNIVCVGYAGLLTELCNRLDIPCVRQQVKIGNSDYHLNCCVSIDDDKYNIHGIYYSDPCWDCIGKYSPPTIKSSLIPYDDVKKIYNDIRILNKTKCITKVTCKKNENETYKKILKTYSTLIGYQSFNTNIRNFIKYLDNNDFNNTSAYKYVENAINSFIEDFLKNQNESKDNCEPSSRAKDSFKTAIKMMISSKFEEYFAKEASKNLLIPIKPDKIYLEKTMNEINYSILELLSQGVSKTEIKSLVKEFFNKELIEEQVLDLSFYYTKLEQKKTQTEEEKLKASLKSTAYKYTKNSTYIDLDTIYKALFAVENSKNKNENRAKINAKAALESSIYSAYVNDFANCNCDYAFVKGAKDYKKKKEQEQGILDDNSIIQK